MITHLKVTAAEMIATLNTEPSVHDPALPVRDCALIPALLYPGREYVYSGRKVMERHGQHWMSRVNATLPTEPGALLALHERQYSDGTLERDAVRQHWLRRSPLPSGTAKYRRPLYSIKVQQLRLRRLASLTDAELARLGLRTTQGGYTFRNDDLAFASPQAAAVDRWGHQATARFPFLTDNPHMWLVTWDEPIPHLPAAERARMVHESAAELHRLDGLIERAEHELRLLRTERGMHSERLGRQLQVSGPDPDPLIVHHGDTRYRVTRHGAEKLRSGSE